VARRINELIETLTPAPRDGAPADGTSRDDAAPRDGTQATQVPLAFRWRGRRYVVGSVLAQWVETGAWWTAEAAAAIPDDAERQLWRVEVCRGTQTGVFDLCLRRSVLTNHGVPTNRGVDGTDHRWSIFAIHD
jgi:hypothetical protein